MNQQPIPIRRTNKTKEDFLHWLKERKAIQKQASDHTAHPDHPDRRAIMVWVDDGGRTPGITEGSNTPSGD